MTRNKEWDVPLFGCMDDLEICCCGVCCIPCLFGNNAEKIDGSNCCLMCCVYTLLSPCYLCWIPHSSKREALRNRFHLNEDPNCGDCPVVCCCGPCALCQEARFLERHDDERASSGHGRAIRVEPHGYY